MESNSAMQEAIRELSEAYEIAREQNNQQAAAAFKLALLERLEKFANTIDTQ